MSVHMATGTTPYNLMYGAEAIMSLELEIPSLRISLKGLIYGDTYHVECLNYLKLLDDHRLWVLNHIQDYRISIYKNYNQGVISHTFKVGDIVLHDK